MQQTHARFISKTFKSTKSKCSFQETRSNNNFRAQQLRAKSATVENLSSDLLLLQNPDSEGCAKSIKLCKSIRAARSVYALVLRHGLQPSIYLSNTLLNEYIKHDELQDARRLFDQTADRNTVTWTALISAYSRKSRAYEALDLFAAMLSFRVLPNHFTFASVLPSIAKLGDILLGKQVHQGVIKGGFLGDCFVASALVDMYGKLGVLKDARQVFDEMSEKDVGVWTSMIAGYAGNSLMEEALALFRRMPDRNAVSWTAVIAGCAQNKMFKKAVQLFWRMPEHDDAVSWNAMIARSAQRGFSEEALRLFGEMKARGVRPNSDTFSGVVLACTNLMALQLGREIHMEIERRGLMDDVVLGNALVDMYTKCGSIEEAQRVFGSMAVKDAVSWTTMIVGFAAHDLADEAFRCFDQMLNAGLAPDHVTFLGLLSACSRAGLEKEAWKFFGCMSKTYSLTPRLEHYCCLVDLLGQLGRLGEAKEFVNKIPIKPNAAIWISLLHSCKIHVHVEVGEYASKRILELHPKNASAYSLLLSIYEKAGMPNEYVNLKARMTDSGVRQKTGCSWIEINKKVHAFVTGNQSHPQIKEIYRELDRLYGHMKELGYAQKVLPVVNNASQERKEHYGYYHSEKLALAFGLINAPPITTLCIHGNLVVCDDCHFAFKLISRIVGRKIILKDTNRFHHFMDGSCSCKDNW